MAVITFKHVGDFKKTVKFLDKVKIVKIDHILKKYGEMGVKALADATPKDTGETASSWSYEIKKDNKGYTIFWNNSHKNQGIPIAILIQFGHGTRNGGYVQPTDFINPAMVPIFEELADAAWREVTSL